MSKKDSVESDREKALKDRDKFQKDQDENRQWHRPQEHKFEVVSEGGVVKGGTAAGVLFLDTQGPVQLGSDEVYELVKHLEASRQAL